MYFRILKTTVCLLLCVTCIVTGSQDTNDKKDLAAVLEHAHQLNTRAQKYLKSTNEKIPEDDFVRNTYKNAIERAEQLLETGLAADAVPGYDVSTRCLNDTKLFLQALLDREQWALEMVDAAGKPMSGLLRGNVVWLGSWEQCLAVEASVYETNTTVSHPFKGQYCRTTFITKGIIPSITSGVCYPSTCNEYDVKALARTLTSLFSGSEPPSSVIPPRVECQKRSLELDNSAIAVIVVCSIFMAIMALATAYDIVIVYWLSKQPSKDKSSKYGSMAKHVDSSLSTDKTPLLGNHNSDLLGSSDDIVVDTAVKNGIISHDKHDVEKIGRYETKPKRVYNAYKPGILGKALLSFSVYTNASKILGTSQPAGTLTAVNGIRFISMTWVILGHTYAFGLQNTENSGIFLWQMLQRFTFQAINNATVAVDTFFVLSGLLVSYLSLKEMKKRGGMFKFNWGMYYFHRFWRLTPPYMLWIMVYVPTMQYWSNGPMWAQQGTEFNHCKNNWWKNILYINNVYESSNQCMGWSWYLANDMQFYVISPVFLIPLYYSPLWGSISCFVFILANFISAGLISKHYEFPANSILSQASSGEYMSKFYMKPWCRIAPYVIGFLTGYILYKTDCKVKMSKLVNTIGWLIATALAMLTLYGLYKSDGSEPNFSVEVAALYNATARTAWGIAVAWVIFACATGYGGPVNTLLSWRAIIPLSRLTYCAYLVHPVIMYTYYMRRMTLMYWYDLEIIYLFLGHACLSYATAFVVSLAFESPMMGLEKVFLGRGKNS